MKSYQIFHLEAEFWITDLIEWAEGGDYFGFERHGEKEMRTYFLSV